MALAIPRSVRPVTHPRQLSWDRGKEFAQLAQFSIDTGTAAYFADPHSPWHPATNDHSNGLFRQ